MTSKNYPGSALAAIVLFFAALCFSSCNERSDHPSVPEAAFNKAMENGILANEALIRSRDLVEDWLNFTDPHTGLIPRNLWERGDQSDIWDPKDAAADNFPFLYITSYFTDRKMFEGEMLNMLLTETALTSRLGRIPDEYSFRKQDFLHDEADMQRIIFGAAEYIKDGLIIMTELLGPGPWKARMMGILDDIMHYYPDAPVLFDNDRINMEINGELLQVLSRVYWMEEDEKYLDYAVKIGDYYLLGDNHPSRDFNRVRLRDHGGEIVSGLTELYATLSHARPEIAQKYREPLYEMLDRILEVGSNAEGLLYNEIDPQAGEVLDSRLADTWGYVINGYYTVYMVDGVEKYRDAVLRPLDIIGLYLDYDWESGSADGDADVIEGALYLYNREPLKRAAEWMDNQIMLMWNKQDRAEGREFPEGKWVGRGVVEGWHGDGNFARTSLMYAMWKTAGTSLHPWRQDVIHGAVVEDQKIILSVSANHQWTGKIIFDRPRHKEYLGLPFDWPRINQFCEWFTVESDKSYNVVDYLSGQEVVWSGKELQQGIYIKLKGGEERRFIIEEI